MAHYIGTEKCLPDFRLSHSIPLRGSAFGQSACLRTYATECMGTAKTSKPSSKAKCRDGCIHTHITKPEHAHITAGTGVGNRRQEILKNIKLAKQDISELHQRLEGQLTNQGKIRVPNRTIRSSRHAWHYLLRHSPPAQQH